MPYASPMRCAALTWMALAGACGAAQPPPHVAPASGVTDPRFVERDPQPYTPRSGDPSRSDSGVGLGLNAPSDQALAVVQRMLRALTDADEPGLQRLFAEQVVYTQAGSVVPRSELLEGCIREARSLTYGAIRMPATLAEFGTLNVMQAILVHAPGPLPAGILSGDLVVQLAPRGSNGDAVRRIPCIANLYVRPGAHAQIVGLSR